MLPRPETGSHASDRPDVRPVVDLPDALAHEIPRPRPYIVVDAPDVLTEQSHAHELRADEHEQRGEHREDTVGGPLCAEGETERQQAGRTQEAGASPDPAILSRRKGKSVTLVSRSK